MYIFELHETKGYKAREELIVWQDEGWEVFQINPLGDNALQVILRREPRNEDEQRAYIAQANDHLDMLRKHGYH